MAVFDPARLKRDKVDERAALRRLARLELRARLILRFEAIWPHIVAACSVLGFALTLALIGLADLLPPVLRGLIFATFMGASIALVMRGLLISRLTREDVLERIDADTALTHRPALSLADRSASHLDDPLTFALWQAHRSIITAKSNALVLRRPQPRIVERDPYALRFAVLISLVAALIVTGPEGIRRIDTALMWSAADEAALQARLDGWIDPPAYTGLPPILFDFKSEDQNRTLRAPVGSIIVLRRSDDAISLPDIAGGLSNEQNVSANEKRFTLTNDSSITTGQHKIAIEAIPDIPPSIALIGNPQKTSGGGLSLSFHSQDDYGIASGTTHIINPRRNDKALTGKHDPLISAPNLPLMPSGDKRNSDGRITLEQSESPWAGATVDMALMVKDDIGQISETGLVTIQLPSRRFTVPLAKSLVEERQRLALDPSTLQRVRESVDLLMIAPELFQMHPSDYLAMREIRTSLDNAENADDLRAVVDLMWNVALMLERGGTDDAENALNAAQDALREALENGASEDEIKALTDKLKEALDAYLKDYAARAMKQMQESGSAQQPDENGRGIRPEDLKSMLDRMQEMAKNGARDDATRMLDALSSILKNLQASRPRLGNPQQGKNTQSLEGLDKMLRDQRGLRDETYKQGRSNPDQSGQLGQRQEGLRSDLDKMREALKGLDQNGQDALGQAGEAMKRAEDALKQGDISGALREQNKALEGLRSGAQALAKQIQNENGEGQDANQENSQQRDRFGQSTQEDPLGRENGNSISDGGAVNKDGDAKGAGESARNVLNELRKRLGQDDRTQDERDYYRRLIGPN